jgi:hypothetical protein
VLLTYNKEPRPTVVDCKVSAALLTYPRDPRPVILEIIFEFAEFVERYELEPKPASVETTFDILKYCRFTRPLTVDVKVDAMELV